MAPKKVWLQALGRSRFGCKPALERGIDIPVVLGGVWGFGNTEVRSECGWDGGGGKLWKLAVFIPPSSQTLKSHEWKGVGLTETKTIS